MDCDSIPYASDTGSDSSDSDVEADRIDNGDVDDMDVNSDVGTGRRSDDGDSDNGDSDSDAETGRRNDTAEEEDDGASVPSPVAHGNDEDDHGDAREVRFIAYGGRKKPRGGAGKTKGGPRWTSTRTNATAKAIVKLNRRREAIARLEQAEKAKHDELQARKEEYLKFVRDKEVQIEAAHLSIRKCEVDDKVIQIEQADIMAEVPDDKYQEVNKVIDALEQAAAAKEKLRKDQNAARAEKKRLEKAAIAEKRRLLAKAEQDMPIAE